MKVQVLEGCSKRFIVQLQGADATAYDWQGGAESAKSAVDMQPVSVSAEGAELLLPPVAPETENNYYPTPARWYYQLRAVDKTTRAVYVVLQGELEVLPWRGATEAAPADVAAGAVAVQANIDASPVVVNVQPEFAAPATVAVSVGPAAAAEDNYNAYGFGYVVPQAGSITALDLECRDSGTATPAATPIWVKVWRGASLQLVAVSANAQVHDLSAKLRYTFAAPFEVAAGEELRVSFHTEDGLAATAYQMGQRCCLRVLAKDPASPGGLLGDQGGYGAASDATQRSWVAKHTWHMQAPLFAPADHTHPGLDELLAHKDELLALLN